MAGLIPATQASPVLTIAVKARLDDLQNIKVNNFARAYYNVVESKERYPAAEVRRGTEYSAVDLPRGHQGTRVQATKFTQKAYDPFYYKLFTDATEQEGYFRIFGSNSFNINDVPSVANGIAVELKSMKDMIDRTVERQCMEIFEFGTVTSLRAGVPAIDFYRKAGSFMDKGAGFYWDVTGSNPFTDMREGCQWMRENGKVSSYRFEAVFGIDAWVAFRENSVVVDRLKQFNNRRDTVAPSRLEATGAVYQGSFDMDAYMIDVYTYSDVFENTDGSYTQYMNPKKVYILPPNPMNTLFYAAVPQVQTNLNTANLMVGQYFYKDFMNPEMGYHRFYIESSPIPVPVGVDQMFTITCLGV